MQIPQPTNVDILDLMRGAVGWYELMNNQLADSLISIEIFASELSEMLECFLAYATLPNHFDEKLALKFWKHHRNFALWLWVTPRPGGYEFWHEKT